MPKTPKEMLSDPDFLALPLKSQLAAMRTVDPEFAALPPNTQGTIMYHANSRGKIPAEPAPDQGFIGTLASDVASIPGQVMHPIKTLQDATAARRALGPKAKEAFERGSPIEGAGYYAASKLPFIGPMAAGIGEDLGEGRTGQGLARVAELAAPYEKVAAGKAAGAAGRAAKSAAAKIPSKVFTEVGGAAGAGLGGLAGASTGVPHAAWPGMVIGRDIGKSIASALRDKMVGPEPVAKPSYPAPRAGGLTPAEMREMRNPTQPPESTRKVAPPRPAGMTPAELREARNPTQPPTPSARRVAPPPLQGSSAARQAAAEGATEPIDHALHAKTLNDAGVKAEQITRLSPAEIKAKAAEVGITPEDFRKIGDKLKKLQHEGHQRIVTHDTHIENKASNIAQHLRESGIDSGQLRALMAEAEQSGNWTKINELTRAAYEKAKAAGKPVPNKPYPNIGSKDTLEVIHKKLGTGDVF